MQGLFSFFLLSRLLGSPIGALVVLVVFYFILDRRFVGLLPDVFKPMRRAGRIRRVREAIDVNPADASAQLELGTLLAEKRSWHAAIPHLEKAAERLDNSQSLFQLGAAYFRVGRLDEGKAALEKALALNPRVGYGEPYVYLAEYQLRNKQSTANIPGLEEALSQYGSVDVCYRLGRLFQDAGENEKARAMFQEALATHKVNPPFLRRQQRRVALMAWLRARLVTRPSF